MTGSTHAGQLRRRVALVLDGMAGSIRQDEEGADNDDGNEDAFHSVTSRNHFRPLHQPHLKPLRSPVPRHPGQMIEPIGRISSNA